MCDISFHLFVSFYFHFFIVYFFFLLLFFFLLNFDFSLFLFFIFHSQVYQGEYLLHVSCTKFDHYVYSCYSYYYFFIYYFYFIHYFYQLLFLFSCIQFCKQLGYCLQPPEMLLTISSAAPKLNRIAFLTMNPTLLLMRHILNNACETTNKGQVYLTSDVIVMVITHN